MKILITRHLGVREALRLQGHVFDRHDPYYNPRAYQDLPRGSTIVGALPVPVAATICRAGHHYQHLIIPRVQSPDAFTLGYLKEHLVLEEFHVEAID